MTVKFALLESGIMHYLKWDPTSPHGNQVTLRPGHAHLKMPTLTSSQQGHFCCIDEHSVTHSSGLTSEQFSY